MCLQGKSKKHYLPNKQKNRIVQKKSVWSYFFFCCL
uniref:Uncharacterized protein n=1 Tax=Siphoviridae sp. ctX581 TaxID=2826365 RepID=A0A8S5MDF4_9CAUD|nr:MAG TPA: hypothetical protein [Siphoviridae sp. ctX581]